MANCEFCKLDRTCHGSAECVHMTTSNPNMVADITRLRDELYPRGFDIISGVVTDKSFAEVVWKINSCLGNGYPRRNNIMHFQDYYAHVSDLPPKLYEIHDYCWDLTGRPNFVKAYHVAIGRICEISADWDEFSKHCDKFFFNKEKSFDRELEIAWHCYVKGIEDVSTRITKDVK